MIYPIVPYGDPILRQKAVPIEPGTDLQTIIEDMFLTMDAADGSGLAAPQVGMPWQLFVVDATPYGKGNYGQLAKFRKVYINPTLEILAPSSLSYYEEGCLSIPGIYIAVPRSRRVRIKFFDSNWKEQEEELTDLQATIVQHEYDHLHGKLHIDYANTTKMLLIKRKLENIRQGKVQVDYPMRFK